MLKTPQNERRVLRRMTGVYHGLALTLAALSLGRVALAQAPEAEAQAEADAPAQAGEEAAPSAPTPSAPAPAEPGKLKVILFLEAAEGKPPKVSVAQAKVSVDGIEVNTSEQGSASLDGISPGSHAVTVTFAEGGSAPLTFATVGFAAGEETQMLLTVDENGALVSEDIEAPEGVAVAAAVTAEPDVAKIPGKIVGVAKDAETGKPIPGVQVYVRGVDEPVKTDEQGQFSVEVPEGTVDLSALHSSYASFTREGVVVQPKGTTEVELTLNPSSAELEDMVITEPFVEGGVSTGVAEEKDSTSVQDVIGAEQMTKSGDSDASSALGRVTGLTVVGGKFIYVRGMGERYSSTLLNGAQVPSPEPERRVVPLDLFPTTVLDSVVVQKTYSPDMPGEFGGGVVQLRTRSYPEEFLFQIGGSLTANTETTFQKGPTYVGGKTDWLGFDDGQRERSDELAAASKPGEPLKEGNRFEPGLTKDELAALGRSLPNKWNTQDSTLLPNGRLNITVGNTHKPGGIPIGYVVAAQYSNEWQHRDELRQTVSTNAEGVQVATSYDLDRSVNTIGLTGMGGLGIEFLPGHSVFSNTMILRTTDNMTLNGEGQGLEGLERFTRLQFVERQLFTQQIRGAHVFEPLNNFQADWRFVYSLADRTEPDRRDYRYDYSPDQEKYLLSTRGNAVARFYSELDDKILEGGLDLMYPLAWTKELVTKIKGGSMILNRKRDVSTFRYQYNIDKYMPVDERTLLREQDMETIMQPENIRADGVQFQEGTIEDEPYVAEQDLLAGYGMVETPLGTKSLNMMAGLRYEHSRQLVESVNETADLETGDWLPAGTLTWAFVEDMQLRAGFSKTVSRPDFRELSLARFFDVESSTEIIGNPDLKRATMNNYDVRYEWYFSGDESVSLAGFYKQFDDPIETVVLAGTSRMQSWQNADAATNLGMEIEGRKRLGFITEAMDSFFIASNLSLIKSQVQLSEQAEGGTDLVNTSTERPLEGQSPYVLNLQFGYDDDIGESGNLSMTVLFNISGRRIDGVGANGAPDIYQESVPRLDFVTRHKVTDHWTWGFRAQNLLNPEEVATQGGIEVKRFRSGMNFSLSAAYTY